MINLEIPNITQTTVRLKFEHKTYEVFKTRRDSNLTIRRRNFRANSVMERRQEGKRRVFPLNNSSIKQNYESRHRQPRHRFSG